MSKRRSNSKLNSSCINNDNKNINIQIKQNCNIHFFKKRKRSYKKKNLLSCIKCKEEINLNYIIFKSEKDLIEKIKSIINNNNNSRVKLDNIIKSKNKILGKFNKSKIICGKCIQEIIIKDDCINKIKELFFHNKRTKINKKNSNFINKPISEIEKGKNDNKENDFMNNKFGSNLNDIYYDEYEECLQNIVLYLKIATLEVSSFVQSFKLYLNYRRNFINIYYANLGNEYFFHSYIQTKIKLENYYILINRIIIKFQAITNLIINSINKINSNDGIEELKTNFDKFIQNTNLILSNILNFVNNYNILMSFLKSENRVMI